LAFLGSKRHFQNVIQTNNNKSAEELGMSGRQQQLIIYQNIAADQLAGGLCFWPDQESGMATGNK